MAQLREKLWIWGHVAGTHNGWTKEIANSKMGPADGARYLGARNMFMIVNNDQPKAPFDDYSRALRDMREVKWSIVGDSASVGDDAGDGQLEEVLRQAEQFPNITGGMFDDFFSPVRMAEYNAEHLERIADKLHKNAARYLDMWCVLYDYDLGKDIRSHLDAFDGISFWTWEEKNLTAFEENYARFLSLTEGKRRMLGCYLYNYGESKLSSPEWIEYQLNTYTQCLERGEAEGIIFCSNTVMDQGFEAVETARNWIAKYGDTEIG